MSLYFMETIPQANQINPAIQPRANWYILMPSVNQAFQSDIAFKDAFQQYDNDWITIDSKRFDFNRLYNILGSTCNFNEYVDINLIGFGFRKGKGYFTLSISERAVVQSGIPADMFKIMEYGFPDDSYFNLSTLRQKGIVYKQISLGYSYKVTDKLTVGVNLKPLFGQMAFMTDINHFSLNTSVEQWKVVANGKVYSSLPIDIEYTQGEFPDKIKTKDLDNKDYIEKYGTSFSNPGFAADLGTIYNYSNKWSFSAALNNLGFINWQKDLNNSSFNGTYLFDGININASNNDSIEGAFEEVIDSLETVINYQTDHKKFITCLTPSLYIGASYHINSSLSLGILSRSAFQKQNFRQDFNLSANLQPYKFMSCNINLNYRIKGTAQMGLGLTFLAGPLQFFILTDHIPLNYSEVEVDEDTFFISESLKDITIMTGFNIIFGRHGYQNKPLLKKYY